MFGLCAITAVLAAPTHAAPRGGRAQSPGRTPPPAGTTIDLRALPANEALARTPVAPDPTMRGLVLAALRRFADGARTPSPVDRAVTRALGRRANAKTIAKRILARIDAMPEGERSAAFGRVALDPAVIDLAQTAKGVGFVFGGVGEIAADTLPAESVKPPSTYALRMSGLAPVELSDGDADGDELVALSTVVTYTGGAFVVATHAAPTDPMTGITGTTPIPLDVSLYDGDASAALVTSVVVETDGEAQVTQEDYGVMVALAQGLATQLVSPADNTPAQKLGRFAFALDYTVGLLAASTPAKWPAGSLQKTILADNASLFALYTKPSSTDGAAKWKLAHDHDLPSGRYKLYFDVPSPPVAQPNVRVKITKISAVDPEAGGADLVARVSINGARSERDLPDGQNTHTPSWFVQRKVAPGSKVATIGLALWDHDPGPKNGYVSTGWSSVKCGDWEDGLAYAPCPPVLSKFDLNPLPNSEDGFFSATDAQSVLVVDLATGDVSGPVSGKVGETIVLQGDHPGARGRVELVVTVQ